MRTPRTYRRPESVEAVPPSASRATRGDDRTQLWPPVPVWRLAKPNRLGLPATPTRHQGSRVASGMDGRQGNTDGGELVAEPSELRRNVFVLVADVDRANGRQPGFDAVGHVVDAGVP